MKKPQWEDIHAILSLDLVFSDAYRAVQYSYMKFEWWNLKFIMVIHSYIQKKNNSYTLHMYVGISHCIYSSKYFKKYADENILKLFIMNTEHFRTHTLKKNILPHYDPKIYF